MSGPYIRSKRRPPRLSLRRGRPASTSPARACRIPVDRPRGEEEQERGEWRASLRPYAPCTTPAELTPGDLRFTVYRFLSFRPTAQITMCSRMVVSGADLVCNLHHLLNRIRSRSFRGPPRPRRAKKSAEKNRDRIFRLSYPTVCPGKTPAVISGQLHLRVSQPVIGRAIRPQVGL